MDLLKLSGEHNHQIQCGDLEDYIFVIILTSQITTETGGIIHSELFRGIDTFNNEVYSTDIRDFDERMKTYLVHTNKRGIKGWRQPDVEVKERNVLYCIEKAIEDSKPLREKKGVTQYHFEREAFGKFGKFIKEKIDAGFSFNYNM